MKGSSGRMCMHHDLCRDKNGNIGNMRRDIEEKIKRGV